MNQVVCTPSAAYVVVDAMTQGLFAHEGAIVAKPGLEELVASAKPSRIAGVVVAREHKQSVVYAGGKRVRRYRGWEIQEASDNEALLTLADILDTSSRVAVGVVTDQGSAVGNSGKRAKVFEVAKRLQYRREREFLEAMVAYAAAVRENLAQVGEWQRFAVACTRLSGGLCDSVEATLVIRYHQRKLMKSPSKVNLHEASALLEERWREQGYAAVLSLVDTAWLDGKKESNFSFRQEIAETIARHYGVQCVAYSKLPVVEVRVPYKDAANVAAALQGSQASALQRVLEAEVESACWLPPVKRDGIKHRADVLWNVEMVQAKRAWELSKGAGVRVAIVDSGVDYKHKEVSARFGELKGYDFFNDSSDPMDDNGHGTHVAGSVAGKEVGVAPEAVLFAVKVLGAEGYGSTQLILQGLDWCLEQKVNVVNMSLGSSQYSRVFEEAVRELYAANVCVVAAAGNSGKLEPHYPSAYEGALSVAAIDKYKKRAPFSTMHSSVACAAPGVQVFSCVPEGYDTFSGTSMATPHVAGVVALLLAKEAVSPAQVEELLGKTAFPLGLPLDPWRKEKYGRGLPQAYDVLLEVTEGGSRWSRAVCSARQKVYAVLRKGIS